MKNIKFLLPVLFTLFMVGCKTVNIADYDPNRFMGLNKAQLVEARGGKQPTEIKVENGEDVYIYITKIVKTDRSTGMSTSRFLDGRAFYFNDKGVVYKILPVR